MRILKESWKTYLLYFGITIIVIMAFSSSTSPLFSMEYSFYGGNDSAASFLICEGWLKGYIPYRDLFMDQGPLFFLIDLIGWVIGKRYGIFFLQIIILTLSLLLMSRIMEMMQIKGKTGMLLTLSMLVPFAGTLSAGNTPEEFMLFFTIAAIYIIMKQKETYDVRRMLMMGMIIAAAIMMKAISGLAIYMMAISSFINIMKKKDAAASLKGFVFTMIGALIIVLPISIYFMANGAFTQMLQAIGMGLHVDFGDIKILVHKLVKSIPAILMIIIALIASKKNDDRKVPMISMGIGFLILSLLGDLNWYNYIIMSAGIPLMLAYMLQLDFKKIVMPGIAILLLVIYCIPIRNYIRYICSEDMSTYEMLVEDMGSYQERADNRQFLMIDMPAYIYLETETIPDYRYFADQTRLSQIKEDLMDEMYAYVSETDKESIIILKAAGFVSESVGDYMLVDMYFKGRTMFAIYEYDPQAHEHEEGRE